MEIPVLEDEELHDLQRNGLVILQKKSGFRFGTDAVLLADFAKPSKGDLVCDMGTGTGILPLLMSARTKETCFEAFELQKEMAQMAERSVRLNRLEDRIRIHAADLRTAAELVGREHCDFVVTNPPYAKEGSGPVSPDGPRAISRSSLDINLVEWVTACGQVLKYGGKFAAVFPAQRFLPLCDAMKSVGIEPKRLRFVASKPDREPKLALVEGIKGGKEGLRILPLLITGGEEGGTSAEMKRIYGIAE